MNSARPSRRAFLEAAGVTAAGLLAWPAELLHAAPRLRITSFELIPVRASARTVWLTVRLRTDAGLTGLGEASDAFGFANTTRQDAAQMERTLRRFFALVQDRSPLGIGAYRTRGIPMAAKGGLVAATAFSAIEQALWDLAGKALDVPTHTLFGGAVRSSVPCYANVNRATSPRTPAGFAAAARAAVADGFKAVKAAPWDGFPPAGSSAKAIETAVEVGIDSTAAMRQAIGPDIELMVDCHSFFDVAMAERVAKRLEPQRLRWYEEPVPPERTDETLAIRRRISQPMAGGEVLFGIAGFAPLIKTRAVDVIMPDVKHCGGLLELVRIAAVADSNGVAVAPHNPSGPVSTLASLHACVVLENVSFLEYQWGEVAWRGELLNPPERFAAGALVVPDRPGLGVELNDELAAAHPI
jgi:galactonate dehydratase